MWQKSSSCKADSPMCVEVDIDKRGIIAIRDSQSPEVTLYFTPDEWREFIKGVKRGEFDV